MTATGRSASEPVQVPGQPIPHVLPDLVVVVVSSADADHEPAPAAAAQARSRDDCSHRDRLGRSGD